VRTTTAQATAEQDRLWAAYRKHPTDANRNALAVAYWPMLWGAAGLSGRHTGIAPEELVSDCFLALRDCIRGFDAGRGVQFSTYAYRAMLRRSYEVFRRGKRQKRTATLVRLYAPVGPGNTVADLLTASDTRPKLCQLDREWIARELEALPVEERAAVVLHVLGGHTLREAGRLLGQTHATVGYHCKKGLARLRRAFRRAGMGGENR